MDAQPSRWRKVWRQIRLRLAVALACGAAYAGWMRFGRTADDWLARRELDQRGGRRIVYRFAPDPAALPPPGASLEERLALVMRRRFERVTRRTVLARVDGSALILELPGRAADRLAEVERRRADLVRSVITRAGRAELRLVDRNGFGKWPLVPGGLSGERISSARVKIDRRAGEIAQPWVEATFDREGARELARLTGGNVGGRLALLVDGAVEAAVVIAAPLERGRVALPVGDGRLEGTARDDAARDLSLLLESGALPASLSLESDAPLQPAP